MKLSQIRIPTEAVELSLTDPDGQPVIVEVRGITTHDLMQMMGTHAPAISMAFGRLMATARLKQKVDANDVRDVIAVLMVSAPDFMGELLALVNDDPTPEGRENAKNLPVPDQLAMLNAAAFLTLRSEAQLKKLVDAARPTVELIYGAMAAMVGRETATASRNGIGASVGKSRS